MLLPLQPFSWLVSLFCFTVFRIVLSEITSFFKRKYQYLQRIHNLQKRCICNPKKQTNIIFHKFKNILKISKLWFSSRYKVLRKFGNIEISF
jgi:hypothetical protein